MLVPGDRELLAALAARLTSTASVSGATVGKLWIMYKTTRPRGRAWQLERNLCKPFLLAHWKRIASSLGPADWDTHRKARKKQKTRLGRPPGDLTLNLELKAIKRVFRYAVRRKMIDERPFIDVKPVKCRTRRESWFTAEQIDKLLEAGYQLRWDHQQRVFRALVAVMADTGLRISEALSLRWDRITLLGTTSVLGKGSKTRMVAFTPRSIDCLSRLDRHPSDPRVFLNWRSHKTYDPCTIRAWFRQAIEIAQLEGVKADGDLALVPHNLRHSFASIADERGAPPRLIQLAMGHDSLKTTQVYMHRSEQDAAIRMAAVMSNRKPPKRTPRLSFGFDKGTTVGKNTLKKILLS